MVQIIRYKKAYYLFSGALFAFSLFALFAWGLKWGVDFKGGSLLMGEFSKKIPPQTELADAMRNTSLGEVTIQASGEKSVIFRFKEVDEKTHQDILSALSAVAKKQGEDNVFAQKNFESIGPSIGKELRTKSITATMIVLALIIGYVAFVFRKVSYPIASWKYGIATLIALFHDVIIPLGLFAALGHFRGVEISSGFIAAILTVLGYSVHDSIVVFDRVRENLTKHRGATFEETVNISVNQTFVRSINTSLTSIFSLCTVYFVGSESIKYIALMLLSGIAVGTYSSIFIGSAILVSWHEWTTRAAVRR